jgi:REP element-mobilizing transposase RayT
VKPKIEFGGTLLIGRRKSQRPLDFSKPIHIVLKADNSECLLPVSRKAENIIRTVSEQCGTQLLGIGIHEDHIHLPVLFRDRTQYNAWIRALPGRLAQLLPNIKWKLRPYSRVGDWGDDCDQLLKYVEKNRRQGELINQAHMRMNAYGEWARKLFNRVAVSNR